MKNDKHSEARERLRVEMAANPNKPYSIVDIVKRFGIPKGQIDIGGALSRKGSNIFRSKHVRGVRWTYVPTGKKPDDIGGGLSGEQDVTSRKERGQLKSVIKKVKATAAPSYWCVNFDLEECMQHGISNGLWMMQYQYEDDFGNLFQAGRQKAATTANWKRLTQIQNGDWCVAYLPKTQSASGNTFFAIGQVRMPRKPATSAKHISTVTEYVLDRRSHKYKSGVVHYSDAPAFYEDFDDKWRPSNPLMRYAQRIDVENWLNYSTIGIPWLDELLSVPLNERRKAFFRINKKSFDKIAARLATSNGAASQPRNRKATSTEIVDDSVAEALEIIEARSQGFMLDSNLRAAIEKFSMDVATKHFQSLGYTVEDHSKNHPYDLKCTRNHDTLYVEVKGTQTNGKGVILTNREVEFARRNCKQMVLFVLHSIKVSEDGLKLSHGIKKVIQPWVVEQAALNPISYKYETPAV